MRYFSTLPKVLVTDSDRNTNYVTDITVRANIINETFNNPLSYYKYDIKDGDTPEIIAEKYYGDPYRYWIVLMVNNIIDPQFDWPMKSAVFNEYVADKYTPSELASIHHYEKTITQKELATNTLTSYTYQIDYDEFIANEQDTTSYTLPSGSVLYKMEKKAVTMYEYELNLNESKRTIQLLNRDYLYDFESQFQSLMK